MSAPPRLTAERVPPEAVRELRRDYLREMNCQVVHESWHERGFMDTWRLARDGATVGYGSTSGDPEGPREVVKELFVAPAHRGQALSLLRALVAASGARRISAQTNDPILAPLLGRIAGPLEVRAILFDDAGPTSLPAAGAHFRRLDPADRARVFEHRHEPVGDWGLEREGAVVATGGILLHYNAPWADLHMEVAKEHRRRGLGSYLVQELKGVCRDMGRLPAARCRPEHEASRRTLLRAGLKECGRIVSGPVVG